MGALLRFCMAAIFKLILMYKLPFVLLKEENKFKKDNYHNVTPSLVASFMQA